MSRNTWIKIKGSKHPSDRDTILDMLSAANGKATTHTVTLVSEVEAAAQAFEDKLISSGIPVMARCGVRGVFTSGNLPKAYFRHGRTAIVTKLVMRRARDGMVLEQAGRCERWYAGGESLSIRITEDVRQIVIAHALRDFTTIKAV